MSTLPSNENHDSTERYYAEMEGARAYAEEEYFNARPQLLATHIERGLFRAGFERAYSALWSKRPRNETRTLLAQRATAIEELRTGIRRVLNHCEHDRSMNRFIASDLLTALLSAPAPSEKACESPKET
jgi:hypothetical protein